MKGLVDYLIVESESLMQEFEAGIEHREEEELQAEIAECVAVAAVDDGVTPHVMFHLLKGCGLRELETFDYAFELDEIATEWGMNIYDTAILILISGLERRCPNGVGISHIEQFTGCTRQTLLEFESSFICLHRMGLIENTKGRVGLINSYYRINQN